MLRFWPAVRGAGDGKKNNVKGEIALKSPNIIEWRLPDFFSIREKIESPSFPYLDGTWRLQYNLVGRLWQNIFLGLMREHSLSEHTIYYRMGIKRGDGLEYISRSDKLDFVEDGAVGELKFVPTACLMDDKALVAPKDEITFFAILESRYNEGAITQITQAEGANKIMHDLKDALRSGNHHDTIIKVQNREFRTHKFILTLRSEVFQSMIKQDPIKRTNAVITIEDCNPDVFKEFLAFFYTGVLENISVENVMDLYFVAVKYQVEEVKTKCVKYMMKNVSVDNFCDFISLALKHSESKLLDSTTDYFVKNTKKIIVTNKWQCFHKEHPKESNELHIKALSNLGSV